MSLRGQRLVDFVKENEDVWRASPNVHLAYRGARTVAQRLYLTCRVDLAEYVRRWSEEDYERLRAHPHDEIRDRLWPWLRERQYAGAEDDERLDAFLDGLGRRDAHLRPGIACAGCGLGLSLSSLMSVAPWSRRCGPGSRSY